MLAYDMLHLLKALKMEYFSNKPGPTPGTQLPRPNSNKIVPQKEENMSLKRKIQAQGGNNNDISHYGLLILSDNYILHAKGC